MIKNVAMLKYLTGLKHPCSKKKFQPYIFMQWPDQFIGAQASKSNMPVLSPKNIWADLFIIRSTRL